MRATEREVREAEREVRMMPTLNTYPSYECFMCDVNMTNAPFP